MSSIVTLKCMAADPGPRGAGTGINTVGRAYAAVQADARINAANATATGVQG